MPKKDEEISDEELAREIQAVDGWSPERMAAARGLTMPMLDAAMGANPEADIEKLAAAGSPIRDFVILTARRMGDHAAERARRLQGRTRTSPVDPCPDYDPQDFWKALEAFRAARRAMEGAVSPATLAAAVIAFRGGPLPEGVPEPELALVTAADAALATVRTVLSVPGERMNCPRGGPKCLDTDQWLLEEELRRFEASVTTRS